MRINRKLTLSFLASLPSLLIALCWTVWSQAQTAAPSISLGSMLQELKSAPRENIERERMLHDLFKKAGATENQIRLMDVVGNQQVLGHNVIVTKPGEIASTIVLGGHLDKVDIGNGVIDDWSGCILIKNLYQALRETKTRHTLQFVCFTMEERGLLGSRQFVTALQAARSPQVVAMVNFECLGPGGPFIWTNGSNDELEAIAHRVADSKKMELTDHVIQGVSADSDSFRRAGIPAITFDGLPLEKFKLIHSEEDRFENIVPERYQAAFQLGLDFVLALDKELPG